MGGYTYTVGVYKYQVGWDAALEVAESVAQDGEGAELVAADGQNSQYRSAIRARTPASIRRPFRTPVRRLLSTTGGRWSVAGALVPAPGGRRPLRLLLVLPSCSALEQGHQSHRDWETPGLPTPTAGPVSGDLHTDRAGSAGRLALDPLLDASLGKPGPPPA
jgi:hypothetical protein